MPKITSLSTHQPTYKLDQEEIERFTKSLFKNRFPNLERLLTVFKNGEIQTRHFCVPLDWHEKDHSFEERNNLYIELATQYGVKAIEKCLQNSTYLSKPVSTEEI